METLLASYKNGLKKELDSVKEEIEDARGRYTADFSSQPVDDDEWNHMHERGESMQEMEKKAKDIQWILDNLME
jgi:hypothetical protein